MYPLDVVKTRMQLTVTSGGVPARGVFGELVALVREGGPRALVRGIASPLAAEVPKRSWKFTSAQLFKENLTGVLPAAIVPSVAGALAGGTETVINAPFEMVKVRLQAKGSVYKSTADAVFTIVRTEGLSSVYRGASAQAARNIVWNGTYFGIIAKLKSAFPDPTTKGEELLRNMAAGSIGGTIATCFNTPFDVVKSRMQNTPKSQPMPSIVGTLGQIYKHEGGARALWKGLTPRLLRLGPGGGIMLVAFDFIAGFLG